MDIKCVRRLIMIERRSFKVMLEWSTPSISDGDWIRKIIAESGNMGSDVSFANMYLLRENMTYRFAVTEAFTAALQWLLRKKGIYLSDRHRQPGKSTASIKEDAKNAGSRCASVCSRKNKSRC